MVQVPKIDSRVTNARYAVEASFKTLPGSPVWEPIEPNEYNDIGAEIIKTPRSPITSTRQRKKGPTTNLNAGFGYQTDVTYRNIQERMQGHFFASFRAKGEEIVTAVDIDASNPDEYEVASTTGFQVGDIIQGQNFAESANNGVNVVTAIVADTSVEVADGQLAAEASPPADAQIVVVGHQAGSGDIDVDDTGNYAAYTSTTLDFTTLGLNPGEFIFVGGDGASEDFVTAANNGWKRIRSIAAQRLTVDKSEIAMVTETGTGLTIRFFFGRVLKDEAALANQVRRTFQHELELGAPDDAQPTQIQAAYVTGGVPQTMSWNIPSADKSTMDLVYLAGDVEYIDGPTALKGGTRPALVEEDAFNTTSDVPLILIHTHSETAETPPEFLTFVQEITFTIDNNLDPNLAVGVLGAFDVTAGNFDFGASTNAYFNNVSVLSAIRDNVDATAAMIMVSGAAGLKVGIALDLPLATLSDGRPNIEDGAPILLPLTLEAATGAKIDPNLNHTAMMVFFDHLPNAAQV